MELTFKNGDIHAVRDLPVNNRLGTAIPTRVNQVATEDKRVFRHFSIKKATET
jgi:hypothetical protein